MSIGYRLHTLEDRSTLFAEGADTFLIILAVEALCQHFIELSQMAHFGGAQQLTYGGLGGVLCQRRVAGDA
jgi:hypothetical protein